MKNPEDLIDQDVVARTLPGELYAKGKVVGYSDHPTYTIEKENGERFSWAANLTELDEDVLLLDVTAGEYTVRLGQDGRPYFRRDDGGSWSFLSVSGDLVLALAREVERLRKEFYLPIPCCVCGRKSLLYLDNEVRCEKCGADTETIAARVAGNVELAPDPPVENSPRLCPVCRGEIEYDDVEE